MKAYKTIVAAIDIEGGSDQVLDRVAQLMEDSLAKLIILNVGYFPITSFPGEYGIGSCPVVDSYIDFENIRKQLLPSLEKMAEEKGLPSNNIVLEFGRPVEMIMEVAERESADLIIVGSHGKHGVALLLGSTANGVLHRAQCDVLAVRIEK